MKIKKKKEPVKREDLDVPPKTPAPIEQPQPQQTPSQDQPMYESPIQPKPKPLPVVREPSRKEVFNNFNNDPRTKSFGAIAISRRTYTFLWIAIIVVITLLAINVFWSNINVAIGKMKGDINVEVNVPERPVNVTAVDNDQYHMNYTIPVEVNNNITLEVDVGDGIADKIAGEVIDIINSVTNSS